MKVKAFLIRGILVVDYEDLMTIVQTGDYPSVYKILDEKSVEEIQEILRDCNELVAIAESVLKIKVLRDVR